MFVQVGGWRLVQGQQGNLRASRHQKQPLTVQVRHVMSVNVTVVLL